MSAQRIQAGALGAKGRVVFADQDGSPADPGGTVTVVVKYPSGQTVAGVGAPATTAAGVYEFTLPVIAAPTLLTATAAAGSAAAVAVIEVVGGFLFSLAEAMLWEPSLIDRPFAGDDILRARNEVEDECARIMGASPTIRYAVERVDGSGLAGVSVSRPWAKRARAVTAWATASDSQAFTGDEIAAIVGGDDGTLTRLYGAVWPQGSGNLVVEYEHGGGRLGDPAWAGGPPEDLRRAAVQRLRTRLNQGTMGLSDRATSASAGDTTYQLSQDGTGYPAINNVYRGYGVNLEDAGSGSQSRPFSAMFDYDPQFDSMFHGGRQ